MKSHLHHSALQNMCYGDIVFIQMHLVNLQVTKLKQQLRLFEMGFFYLFYLKNSTRIYQNFCQWTTLC